ncbi:3610_t:CDS:1, partial [Gigaspora rosea]
MCLITSGSPNLGIPLEFPEFRGSGGNRLISVNTKTADIAGYKYNSRDISPYSDIGNSD